MAELKRLKDISYYVDEKIENVMLNHTTYIGVDNMLPNCAGVSTSNYVPAAGMSTKFQNGDILIGNIRPYFKKIWLATFSGGCSPDVLVIRCKNANNSKFVYAALATDTFFNYDTVGAKGSKMPRGDKTHIMNYPINFVDNYMMIGEFLCEINNQIQRNNAMVHKLQLNDTTISCFSTKGEKRYAA